MQSPWRSLPLSPTYQSIVTNRSASHYTCTTGTADQVYVVLASLSNDSLLFPLLVVILCSSFRLCGAFLSLVCRFYVAFFYNWMANFMRNYTPPPAYNPATPSLLDPSLIYDMSGATSLLVHYHHTPYAS